MSVLRRLFCAAALGLALAAADSPEAYAHGGGEEISALPFYYVGAVVAAGAFWFMTRGGSHTGDELHHRRSRLRQRETKGDTTK